MQYNRDGDSNVNITDVYHRQLIKDGICSLDEVYDIRDDTSVSGVELVSLDPNRFQFQFSTKTPWGTICQYATWEDGKFTWRESFRWFVPGDVLFETFNDALRFLKKKGAK